jgi:hypothetical protein
MHQIELFDTTKHTKKTSFREEQLQRQIKQQIALAHLSNLQVFFEEHYNSILTWESFYSKRGFWLGVKIQIETPIIEDWVSMNSWIIYSIGIDTWLNLGFNPTEKIRQLILKSFC